MAAVFLTLLFFVLFLSNVAQLFLQFQALRSAVVISCLSYMRLTVKHMEDERTVI